MSFKADIKFFIIVIVISYLLYLGLYMNDSKEKSYSDGSITFIYNNYDFYRGTPPDSLYFHPIKEIEKKGWSHVASFQKEGITYIGILTNERFKDPELAQKTSETIIKSNVSSKILLSTKETNPNGIQIFKSEYTFKDPSFEDPPTFKCIDYYFKDKKGTIYLITIYGLDTETQKEYSSNASNTIFNSLKLN